MHDLLHDPLIGIRTSAGPIRVSLPALFARLSAGDVEGYSGLRPHQSDPWHVFLVQVAASVLARHPDCDPARPPTDVGFWRDGLLDLAEGQASAWELMVEDVTKPAFMQHPLAGGTEELQTAFRSKAASPDELDVLITAKNHDLKMTRARADSDEAWLFALVTYQTTSGFLGQGNYGTVRMNGGFASRAVVSMVRSTRAADRFVEELGSVCASRQDVIARHGFVNRGLALCWIRHWSRDDSMCVLTGLEPWFVEAVRPLRIVRGAGGMLAMGASSKARLVGPKSLDNGLVGDPWIPVNVEDKKKGESALTLPAAGWTSERLVDMLFEQGFRLTPIQRPRPGQGDLWFIGSVIVRGQGTTDGFHTFRLPVPSKVRATLVRSESAQSFGAFARELLQLAANAMGALRSALMSVTEGGPEALNFDKKAVTAWIKQATAGTALRWNDRFFPALWRAAEPIDREVVKAEWKSALVDDVRRALERAEQYLPLPSGRHWRAVIRARWLLDTLLRKAALLPNHSDNVGPEEAKEQAT